MNNINKFVARFILSATAVAFTATASLSAPITIPAGLNPGDQYRLAFVTSTTRDGTSANIADYNAFVTAAANSQTGLATLGTTWMAIASTGTVNARDNTGTNPFSDGSGFPIYLLDAASTKIADDNADLWDGSIAAPFATSEAGIEIASRRHAWTGTRADGTSDGIAYLGSPFGSVPLGRTFETSSSWVMEPTSVDTTSLYRLYAISGVLTVAPVEQVAEPGAIGVLALGLIGLGFARRRKRIS